MNISHFFIDRPRFAVVISIVIVLLGAIAFPNLPVAQFPEVAPPTVVVRANYPGATPDVVAETVAAPLEQEINGVEQMLYLSSQATSDGALAITVTLSWEPIWTKLKSSCKIGWPLRSRVYLRRFGALASP